MISNRLLAFLILIVVIISVFSTWKAIDYANKEAEAKQVNFGYEILSGGSTGMVAINVVPPEEEGNG